MTPIERLRQNPAYASMSDDALVAELHKRPEYADIEINDFRSRLGLETVSAGQAAFQGATQGATMGFADEIGAFGRAAIDKYLNRIIQPDFVDDRPFGEVYADIRDRSRGELGRARRERPGMTYGTELATGVLQGGAGAGAAAGTQTLRQALPRLAGVGAAYGGVAGLGYSEGETAGEIAQDTAVGAGMGGALGAGLPALGAGVRRVAGSVARRVGSETAASEAARRTVLKGLRDSGLSVDEAEKALRANPHLTLADLGDNMQQEAAQIVQRPGRGGERLRTFLTERNRGQFDRVMPSLQKGLGGASRNLADTEQEIIDTARKAARPLYDEAYETPVKMTETMRGLMERPIVRRAFKDAVEDAQNEGLDLASLGVTGSNWRLEEPIGGSMAKLNMRRLHLTLQNLRRKSNNARIQAPGDAARYDNIRRTMQREIVKQNSAFGRAQGIWRDKVADEEALEAGMKLFSGQPDRLNRSLQRMTDSERANYMVGALRAIETRLSKKVDTADMLRELRDTRHGRELLKTLFGNDTSKFNEFMRMGKAEMAMLETYRKAATGSPTFGRASRALEQQGENVGLLAGISLGSQLGIPGVAFASRKIGKSLGRVAERADVARRDAVAELLMSRDPSAVVNQLRRPALPAPGALTSTAALTGSRMVPGLLE